MKACEASGKSVSEYAAEQGFRVGAMYAGKKVLVRKGVFPSRPQARFQRVLPALERIDPPFRTQLPNSVSVVTSGAVEGASLSMVLKAAAHLS